MRPTLLYIFPLPCQPLLPKLCELAIAAYAREWPHVCLILTELGSEWSKVLAELLDEG